MVDLNGFTREGLGLDVVLHYADSRGAASKRLITIHRVYVAGDIHFDAYCHLRKAPRTFLGRNMIDVADGETGELLDVVEFTARLLDVPKDAVAGRMTVKRKTRPRTADHDITFGPDGMAVGWVFGVLAPFRAALDIELMYYKGGREWTRGAPPQIAFDVGDIFYDPPTARGMVWGEALKLLRRSVQITAARPDAVRYETGWEIDPGEVTFVLTNFSDGQRGTPTKHTLSQAAFADFLRAGQLPAKIDQSQLVIELPEGVAVNE